MAIEYRLNSIVTNQFATIDDVQPLTEQIKVLHSFGLMIGNEAKNINISYKVVFQFDNKPFIVLDITMVFGITLEEDKKLKVGDNFKVTLPEAFTRHLASITMHTARGILFSNLANTAYNNIVLPIYNIDNIDFNSETPKEKQPTLKSPKSGRIKSKAPKLKRNR